MSDTTPAPAQVSTPAPSATPDEHMIPKSRFDEINTERQQLAARLAQIEAERNAETEKRLEEQNRWKELAESRATELAQAKAEAAKVGEYETTLAALLEKQVADIPEDKRALIPTYGTTQQRLEWIANNRALLAAPQPFAIGAGKQGAQSNENINLTPEEVAIARRFGLTPEEYAKFNK
jgi:phage I-like protein